MRNKEGEFINRKGKTEDANESRSDPRLNDAVGQGLGSDRLTESGVTIKEGEYIII